MEMASHLVGVVLLGPTGSGKTPLGEYLVDHPFPHWRFYHFDFGAQLRAAASNGNSASLFNVAQRELIRQILNDGRLLREEEFFIAERVLQAYLGQIPPPTEEYEGYMGLILNGLPRTIYQAARIGERIPVPLVVCLECEEGVIVERIRANVGGDRTGRCDDQEEMIRRKFRQFITETKPLAHFYHQHGAKIIRLPVGPHSEARHLWDSLLKAWPNDL